ncbi:MAG: hypothetical protein M3145_01490 [Pseudomonadota bacterium]|nr:hypothetical protein [Pseudomonadota bacterium]
MTAPGYDGGSDFPVDELPRDDLPARDINEDLEDRGSAIEAAMRAADRVFGGFASSVSAPASNGSAPEIPGFRGHGDPLRPSDPVREPATEAPKPDMQANAEAAAEPPTVRILPDLQWEDPVEARLRQEAEERAARRHGPRGPRKKAEPKATRTEPRPAAEQGPARKTARKRKLPFVWPDEFEAEPVPAAVAHPAPAVAQPVGTPKLGRPATQLSNRKARQRRAAVSLRAGERWKRRLPQVCW